MVDNCGHIRVYQLIHHNNDLKQMHNQQLRSSEGNIRSYRTSNPPSAPPILGNACVAFLSADTCGVRVLKSARTWVGLRLTAEPSVEPQDKSATMNLRVVKWTIVVMSDEREL